MKRGRKAILIVIWSFCIREGPARIECVRSQGQH